MPGAGVVILFDMSLFFKEQKDLKKE